LTTQSSSVPLISFLLNLLLAALLCALPAEMFTRFGSSFSNRRQFGGNFILIGMATMIVITIVKSSLALSLGLVGALSKSRKRGAGNNESPSIQADKKFKIYAGYRNLMSLEISCWL
jgi:hypothetical protein